MGLRFPRLRAHTHCGRNFFRSNFFTQTNTTGGQRMTAQHTSESRLQVHDRTFRPYILRDEVQQMVRAVAKQINHDFAGKEVTLLVVLKGAMVFAAALMRLLDVPVTIETIRASSYRNSVRSSGTVSIEDWVPDVDGRHVILVEDIVDSGTTITELVKYLSSYQPASVAVAALLSKPDIHQGRIQIDYAGRDIAPDFVVGYGLDYAGYGRQLDAIWIEDETLDT